MNMALTDVKLRKIVNLLSDPLQAHAAANLLAIEAKERGVLVSDLIAGTLTSPPPPMATPTFTDVDGGAMSPFAGTGRRINRNHYGLSAFVTHETARAWLVEGPNGEIWLPKSECEHHGDDPSGRAILIVPMWLARKKGLPL